MAGLLSPEQLATIQGLQRIRAAMSGTPNYFGAQARADAGLAPGAYQFNISGPAPAAAAPTDPRAAMLQALTGAPNAGNADAIASRDESLPGNVDPLSGVRGSVPNNMRAKFLALATANTAPTEAQQAVASRRPNLSLTFGEFQDGRQQQRDALRQKVDELTNGKTMEALGPDAEAAASEAERKLNLMDATSRGLSTAADVARLRRDALAARPKPKLVAPGREQGAVAERKRAAPAEGANLQSMLLTPQQAALLGMTPAQMSDHNLRVAAIQADVNARRDAQSIEREKLGVTRDDLAARIAQMERTHQQTLTQMQQNHDLTLAELRAKLDEQTRRFGLDQKVADAKIEDMKGQREIDQQAADPQHSLNQSLMAGQMTPEVFQHLQELHNSADLYPGPDWFFRGPYEDYLALHRHFGQAHPEIPKTALRSLLDQYFLRNPDYGQIPEPTAAAKSLGMTGSLFDRDFRY